MSEGINLYLAITACASGSSVLLALLAWRRREVPGAVFLSLLLVAAAIWCAACVAELLAPTLVGKVLSARIGYLGIVSVPWAWLLFVLTYTGRGPRRLRGIAILLGLLPLTTLALVWLSARLPLQWSAVRLSTAGGPHPLLVEHGPWFWVFATFAYSCLLAGSALLVQSVLRGLRPLTAQGVIIALAVLLPLGANVLTIVAAVPLKGLDLTPLAIAASGALVALALLRLQALDVYPGIVPAARDTVLEGMRDGVLIVDRRGYVLDANRACQGLLQSDGQALLGRRVEELLAPACGADRACFTLAGLTAQGSLEAVALGADGEKRYLETVASPLGGEVRSAGYVLVMRDVSERKTLEEKLLYRALHDDLTELPNRRLLQEHLGELLKLAKRSGEDLSLLIIDLDGFREINDTFGPEAGDELLVVMAERLSAARRESDLVARLGGDEFALVLPACPAAEALAIATSLRDRLGAPIELRDQQIVVSAAVGVAASPRHGRTPGTLLRHADVALHDAKEALAGVAAYRAQRDPNRPARLALVGELRTALASDWLTLYYQPEIELRHGGLARLEALARWPHADGHLTPPATFVPLAEKYGLLPALTRWALRSALAQCAAWNDAGHPVSVAVNLSVLDLHDQALVERVGVELERAGVAPEHLWLEVTETSVMRDPERARRVLERLRDIGVRVAVDDFGTGHSSLAYLRSLPAADVKVDQSFVRGLASEPQDEAIVRAAVQLSHDLGLTATAEGVEDGETLERLCGLGCDHAQGYFIAKPMPAPQALAWLLEGPAARLPIPAKSPKLAGRAS